MLKDWAIDEITVSDNIRYSFDSWLQLFEHFLNKCKTKKNLLSFYMATYDSKRENTPNIRGYVMLTLKSIQDILTADSEVNRSDVR